MANVTAHEIDASAMIVAWRRRRVGTWLVLIAATLLSWESARSAGIHRVASAAVLLIAFLKARLIGLEFMELREAPLLLRLAFEAWTVIVCILLLALYWFLPPG